MEVTMRRGWLMAVVACAAAAGASSAAAEGAYRIVLIIGRPGDPLIAEQTACLAQRRQALDDRDVRVVTVTPKEAARDWPAAAGQPASDRFRVLLIGKDGGVKLRRDRPVDPAELESLIDTMPMRRQEREERGR